MSFFVVHGDRTEEFSMDCSLEDIHSYFGLENGGLRLNGMGPIVSFSDLSSGEAYELTGTSLGVKVIKKIQKKKNPSGVSVVEKVVWEWDKNDPEDIAGDEETIPRSSSASSLQKRSTQSKKRGTQEKSSGGSSQVLSSPLLSDSKPINWTLVTVACILIFFCMFIGYGYMKNYQVREQLILRNDADQLTLVTLCILLTSFLFGILAFFH